MQNLLNQIRDIVRNSFDRFLCALPVIGDALRLVRILYQLVQDAKTQRENLLTHICEIGNEVTDLQKQITVTREEKSDHREVNRCRERLNQIARIISSIREELHERIATLQHSTTVSFDVVLALHTLLRERVEELKPLVPDMTVEPTVEPTVEELQAAFEIWKENCCSPCN